MQKIKILRIIARLNIGGPAIHTILLTEGLNDDAFSSTLVTGSIDKTEADMLYLAKAKGVNPIIIPELTRQIQPVKDLIALAKIYKIIKLKAPDIVHTHTAKAGCLGRLAALFYNLTENKKKCRLVHTFHGHVLEGYFGKIRTYIFVWIERILGKATDKLVVVSQRIKEDLLKLGIGNPSKIIIVPLGLELERLLEIPMPVNTNSTLKIGIIGRLVPIKNHWMFLQAAKKMKNEHKNNIKFFIIGDGQLRDKLEDYTRELGIENEVVFMGWQKNLENIYQDLDIVALTSLNEGLPVSLIEAMAAGKAVIATDVGGVADLIGNNERGILVKSGDTGAFFESLRVLLESPTLRKEIGQGARDFVKTRFTKERLIKDVELLYNNFF